MQGKKPYAILTDKKRKIESKGGGGKLRKGKHGKVLCVSYCDVWILHEYGRILGKRNGGKKKGEENIKESERRKERRKERKKDRKLQKREEKKEKRKEFKKKIKKIDKEAAW